MSKLLIKRIDSDGKWNFIISEFPIEWLKKNLTIRICYGSQNSFADSDECLLISSFKELKKVLVESKVNSLGENLQINMTCQIPNWAQYEGKHLSINYYIEVWDNTLFDAKIIYRQFLEVNFPIISTLNLLKNVSPKSDFSASETAEKSNKKSGSWEAKFWMWLGVLLSLFIVLISLLSRHFYGLTLSGITLVFGAAMSISNNWNYWKFEKKDFPRDVQKLCLQEYFKIFSAKDLLDIKVSIVIELLEKFPIDQPSPGAGSGKASYPFVRCIANDLIWQKDSIFLPAKSNIFDLYKIEIDRQKLFGDLPEDFCIKDGYDQYALSKRIVVTIFVPGLPTSKFNFNL